MFSARIPSLIIADGNVARLIFSALLAIIGLGVILTMRLNSRDYEYRSLKSNALIFDKSYLDELREKYILQKRRYIYLIVASLATILFGAVGLLLRNIMRDVVWTAYNVIYTIAVTASIGYLQYGFTMMDAYELLVNNNEFINKITTRFLNKMRGKTDRLFRK